MSSARFVFDTSPHGSGGFAKVIKGFDSELERDIAVKVLDPLVTHFEDKDRERFRREARILAKLSHPNIPAIYDVNFTEDQFIIIFEFIDGITLQEYISTNGPCSFAQAKMWFSQVSMALSHAHENGIIHRDIKPVNIILSPDFHSAYLVDFGIALSEDDGKKITESGFTIGTPGYMSPEQLSAEVVDHRTDIYSLGVTLYEALAGQQIAHGSYSPLSASNEAIPNEVDSLILDCIIPKEQRVQSAKEFERRISGLLILQRTFSEVLTHGRLNELAQSLENMSAESFNNLPEGQKALVTSKIESIVEADEEALIFPGSELLEIMLTRGILLSAEKYRYFANRAIYWAFEKIYPDGRQGRRTLQEALKEACQLARGEVHEVLHEEMSSFLESINFEEKEDWYLHVLRDVISCLMANPEFTGDTSAMTISLQRINELQRTRPKEKVTQQ